MVTFTFAKKELAHDTENYMS
jgi:hypothetical protein